MKDSFLLSQRYCPGRADVIFSKIYAQHSRSQIGRYIRNGHVLINGKIVKPSKILTGGESVSVNFPKPEPTEYSAEKIDVEIIYENSDFAVVNKPAGMVVHAGAGNTHGTLVNALLYHCKDLSGIGGKIRPGIVHRLDKETSGVMVVAKNDFTHSRIAEQFKRREVSKVYLAIVHGIIKTDQGKYVSKIGRHKKNRVKMSVNTNYGRDSTTYWMLLKRFRSSTLVQVMPQTGRTHQIRVHFSESGHPILADKLYGDSKKDKLLLKDFNKRINRHTLHAEKIKFLEPRSGKTVEFTASVPTDFSDTLNFLEQSN